MRKTVGEDVYAYVWIGKQMVEEHGPDGVRKFVYGDGVDEPVCMVEPDGGIYYFHRGTGKSVIALSDESGAVVETYAYTPFGKPSVNETGGTLKSQFLFAGRWYEADAGIYYYRARHYHPELRTFLQPDPLGYEDGLNWYAYVHNNPVNYWDPDGLWTIQIGFSGAFSFWGGGFTSGMGIAISGNEHGYEFGTYSVNGAGASSGDLSGMVDITWSSNESISDLSGSAFTAGG